jgi:hypothetical protein
MPVDFVSEADSGPIESPSARRATVLGRVYGSRLLIPICGLLLLALFGVLYLVNTALYMDVLTWLTKKPFSHPFIDWEWIPSTARCWRLGVDVYTDNTCYEPIAHGRHGYSPLWLRMTFLPYSRVSITVFGLSIATLFFATLATLPSQRRAGAFWVTLLVTLSPVAAYALERANVDLIMFILAIVGVNFWFGPRPMRLAGYAIFMIAGLLKFYPFVLLVLALREKPRMFAGIFAATLTTLLAFTLAFRSELARIGTNIPVGSPIDVMFAATNLPYGLAMMIFPAADIFGDHSVWAFRNSAQSLAGHGGLAFLIVIALACAIALERRIRLTATLATMRRREAGFLVAGAALVCGCFFAGQSMDYRTIMFIPALPGLLWLRDAQPNRAWAALFMAACLAIVSMMWIFPIQQVIATEFGPYGAVAFLHWLLNQLLWWFVVTILLAVLLSFALNSEMGRFVALLPRPATAPDPTSQPGHS